MNHRGGASAQSRHGAPRALAPGLDEDRIFLKVMPAEIEETAIRAAFAEFGDVTDVYLPRAQSGPTKYGFVRYSDPQVVESVLSRQEVSCAGVMIPIDATLKSNMFHEYLREVNVMRSPNSK